MDKVLVKDVGMYLIYSDGRVVRGLERSKPLGVI